MKPVAYMIWAPFSGPAQFTTDPRAPEMTAQRADYTCTPLVTERDALAALEQARREEREAIISQLELWFAANMPTNLMWAADQLRARGESGKAERVR